MAKRKRHGAGGGGSGSSRGTAGKPSAGPVGRAERPGSAAHAALLAGAYKQFVKERGAGALPPAVRAGVSRALTTLDDLGFFTFDVVAAGQAVSATFVRRTLVGAAGTTYFYQRLRLFSLPWEEGLGGSGAAGEALRAVGLLNEALRSRAELLGEQRCAFNVSLINRMSPPELQERAVPLRQEERFGLGLASVSWHADSSLVPGSTIAVYQETDAARPEDEDWAVALRCTDEDGVPAVVCPLRSGDTYYMLGDFNLRREHAVLTGRSTRFACTHRVAVTARDTFEYISARCTAAAARLAEPGALTAPEALQRVAEVHIELEFEWLRMFWLHGERHAEQHASWWRPRIEELEVRFWEFERALKACLRCLKRAARGATPGAPARAFAIALWWLGELLERRVAHDARTSAAPYRRLPPDCRPVERPAFSEDAPLPRDVAPIIATVTQWRAEHAALNSASTT